MGKINNEIKKLNESIFNNLNEQKSSLKETKWKFTLDDSLRKAIKEEDYNGIIAALKHYNEVIQSSNELDEFTKEEFQKFIDDYELDFQDIEALEVDDPEESIDYILSDFYDLCDNTRVFIQLKENSLKESITYRNIEAQEDYITLDDNGNIQDVSVGEFIVPGQICGLIKIQNTTYLVIKDDESKLSVYSVDTEFPYTFKKEN